MTATLGTKVHRILELLSHYRISCVPILDSRGVPIAVYSRQNLIDLELEHSIENSLDKALGSHVFGSAYDELVEHARAEKRRSGRDGRGGRGGGQGDADGDVDGDDGTGGDDDVDGDGDDGVVEVDVDLGDYVNFEVPERMSVHTCSVHDTLQQVFIHFAEVRVHRLLYVDDDGSLLGIVSLSDLLSYFLDEDGEAR